MSGKKIAFVGSPWTHTALLQQKAVELIDSDNISVVQPSIRDSLIGSVFPKYQEYLSNSEEIDLATIYARRMEILSYDPENYIVSDQWALNDLASVMVKMNNLQNKINSSSQMLGPDGQPIFTNDHGMLLIVQAAFQIILNQVAVEKDFWDFLYYLPIYDPGDDILDEDGVAPKNKLHQKESDLALTSLIKQLQLDVVSLPASKEESLSFLEDEKRKWN